MNTKNNFLKIVLAGTLVFTGFLPVAALADNPIPATVSISPSTVLQGSTGFNLTINGSNFVPGSTVSINGITRPTTYILPTQLTVAVPASDISNMGTFNVSVNNAAPGGGNSNVQILTVTPTASTASPIVSSISPISVMAGSGAFNLSVAGNNFVPGSVIRFNGITRTTSYVSANQLTTVIGSADVAMAGNQVLWVENPVANGGISNSVLFTINPTSTIPGLPDTGFGPDDQASGLKTGLLVAGFGLLSALSALIVAKKVLAVK